MVLGSIDGLFSLEHDMNRLAEVAFGFALFVEFLIRIVVGLVDVFLFTPNAFEKYLEHGWVIFHVMGSFGGVSRLMRSLTTKCGIHP